MATKVDIWMPLYIADYLSATSRLTTEQHGAYLLLLMDYWKSGAPPDNDVVLAQITKLSPDAWANARTMLEPFFEVQDGAWFQPRVESEMAKANHNKKANKERGMKGAQARWGNKNAPTMLEAYSEQCSADSTSPSPSPSFSKNKKKAAIAPIVLPDWMPVETWGAFLEMRKKIKKPPTDKAIELLISKLEKFKANGQSVQAVLEKSITSNWQDVFEIHEKQALPNKFDVAHVTTPPPPNQDAALKKIEADRKTAVPPSPEILAKLAKFRKQVA